MKCFYTLSSIIYNIKNKNIFLLTKNKATFLKQRFIVTIY